MALNISLYFSVLVMVLQLVRSEQVNYKEDTETIHRSMEEMEGLMKKIERPIKRSQGDVFTGTTWSKDIKWCLHETGQLLMGDFNADGRTDWLCHDTSNGYKWIAYADKDGFFSGTNWEKDMRWCLHATGELYVGDFNGDRRDDLLCHDIRSGQKWIALNEY